VGENPSPILRLTIHKVGDLSPKGRLPIGNPNNQYCINSLSADADATVRRTVAYLMVAEFLGCFCVWVGNQKVGDVSPKHRIGVSRLGTNLTMVIDNVFVLVYVRRQISRSADADATAAARGFHPTIAYLVNWRTSDPAVKRNTTGGCAHLAPSEVKIQC
jgi:hypothetical protein